MTSSIRQWLEALGLSQYADVFEANDIDVSLLPDLNNQVLKDIGVASAGTVCVYLLPSRRMPRWRSLRRTRRLPRQRRPRRFQSPLPAQPLANAANSR